MCQRTIKGLPPATEGLCFPETMCTTWKNTFYEALEPGGCLGFLLITVISHLTEIRPSAAVDMVMSMGEITQEGKCSY